MTRFVLKAWIGLFLFLLSLYGSYSIWRVYQAMASAPAPVESSAVAMRPTRDLDEFSFVERSGQTVHLADLKGKVWVGSFFFTECPGFCLQMNHEVAALSQEFANSGVTFVSVSVDPEKDTLERLREYADKLGADSKRWLFLIGDMDDVQQLGQDVFKVTVVGKEHSDRLILVDRDGTVVGRYRSLEPTQLLALKRQLKKLLAEPKADG
ncbi:MAG: SCO family protein [Pirellulales bacterium]